jgi:hypothetical protein
MKKGAQQRPLMPERQRQSSGHIDQRSRFLTEGVDHRRQGAAGSATGTGGWSILPICWRTSLSCVCTPSPANFMADTIAPRLAGVAARLNSTRPAGNARFPGRGQLRSAPRGPGPARPAPAARPDRRCVAPVAAESATTRHCTCALRAG